MKRSSQMLAVILTAIMVIGIFPLSVSAANKSNNVPNNALNTEPLMNHTVRCVLSTGVSATGANISLNNQLDENDLKTFTLDSSYGALALPAELSGTYTVSASFEGPVSGLKWTSREGLTLNASLKGTSYLILFPVLTVDLEYGEHNAYMVGYSDGSFKPEQTITRGEAATLLYRIMTEDAREKYCSDNYYFSDVQKGMAHSKAVSALVNAGLIEYAKGNSFGYKAVISRAQFAEMIGQLFPVTYTGADVFNDVNGHYAASYLNLLGALGIFNGDGDGNVKPDDPLTRGAACTILNRLLGRMPSAERIARLGNSNALKEFSDLSSDMVLYADIMEATNSHSFTWTVSLPDTNNDGDDVIAENWTNLSSSLSWIKN